MGDGADEIALASGDDIAADDAAGDGCEENRENRPLQIIEFNQILQENHYIQRLAYMIRELVAVRVNLLVCLVAVDDGTGAMDEADKAGDVIGVGLEVLDRMHLNGLINANNV